MGVDVQDATAEHSRYKRRWKLAVNMSQTNIGGATRERAGNTEATTGTGMASLLLGYPNSVSIAPAVIPLSVPLEILRRFVQDDFR